MPCIEFIGYKEKEIDANINKILPILKKVEFSKDILIIRKNITYKVYDLCGKKQQFVRIYTRSRERAFTLIDLLKKYFDIEIIYIGEFITKN